MSWIILILFVIFIFCFLRWHFNYWQRLNVPFLPSLPIVGNVYELIFGYCCFGELFKSFYNRKEANDQEFVGIHVLFNHALLIREPALIKRILVEDFRTFSNRFEATDALGDPMGSLNLFFANYKDWKEMHRIFTPFFAINRVKKMYPLMVEIALKLETNLLKRGECFLIECKELSARFTTDNTASLAFGIEENSIEKEKSDLRRMCIEVNEPKLKRLLHLFVIFFFPSKSRLFKTHFLSTEYENFMRSLLTEVMEHRINNNFERGDLIDAFVELTKDKTLPSNSVVYRRDFYAAHAAFLLLAGFDTSSSTITFALYELAKDKKVQEKLRLEVLKAIQTENDSVNYENMLKLEYLDCVVKEVLRLYPPTPFLDRCCSDSEGFDLRPFNNFTIPKGMPVYVSVLALHHDEQFWPEPMSFKPERFTPENAKHHTPMTYLPFGAGPRACIGTLLGMLQVKLGIIHILKNFRVDFDVRTPKVIKFDPRAFVLTPNGGIYLKLTKLVD